MLFRLKVLNKQPIIAFPFVKMNDKNGLISLWHLLAQNHG